MMKKVGDLLREFLREHGWLGEDPSAVLFLQWQTVAGEDLAAHSRPVEIEGGTLIVEADHPGWLQLLLMKKASLLSAVQRAAPAAGIRGLSIRLGH
jgi:predicted nucleic acid-binding Zn ribbon protein